MPSYHKMHLKVGGWTSACSNGHMPRLVSTFEFDVLPVPARCGRCQEVFVAIMEPVEAKLNIIAEYLEKHA